MTPQEIALIRSTWQHALPIADTAAELFYARLFETDPSTRALFARSDMPAQRRKLMQAIAAVVASLDRLAEIVPAAQELGRRHAGYSVTDSHYDSVGAALIWTFERSLGGAWSSEAAVAWAAAYGLLARTMREAAQSAAPSRAA